MWVCMKVRKQVSGVGLLLHVWVVRLKIRSSPFQQTPLLAGSSCQPTSNGEMVYSTGAEGLMM